MPHYQSHKSIGFKTGAFFLKKESKTLADSKKVTTFAPVKQKGHGSVAQLNRASDYGSEGYRFESCRNHEKEFIL